MSNLGRILMVEDDPKDVELTLTALENIIWPMRSWLPVTDKKLWIISAAGVNTAIVPKRTLRSYCST